MDLQRLESSLLADETHSFSEAGTQLHITQPAISSHIKMLETELGVELSDRSTPSLRRTGAAMRNRGSSPGWSTGWFFSLA